MALYIMFVLPTVYAIDLFRRVSDITTVGNKKRVTAADDLDTRQFYREVGIRIRDARKKVKEQDGKLTQEALAESVGLERTSLTNIEKGRQRLLLHTFSRIATALRVSPTELLPDSYTILQNLGLDLPKTLRPEERGFIETTMSPGGTHETLKRKADSTEGERTSTKKRSRASAR